MDKGDAKKYGYIDFKDKEYADELANELLKEPESPTQNPIPEPPFKGFDDGKAREAFGYVNQYRVANGLAELTWDDTLSGLSKTRAEESVTSEPHKRTDGREWHTILNEYGVVSSYAGENLALGNVSVKDIVDGWYASPGHKENMLDSRYTKAGMGCYSSNGTDYYINIFME